MTQQISGRQIKDGSINNARVAAGAEIESSKLAAWSVNRDAGSNKLVNLANGTAAQDAVTKAQLDAAITASQSGLTVKLPVRAASAANVSGTYTSTGGASGRGQFTGMPTSIDGVSLAADDRVLLKDQSSAAENGIWVVTTLGSGSNGIWDRASDFDEDAEVFDGCFVLVQEGGQETTQWVLTTDGDLTVGGASGSSLTFSQFGASVTYTADEVTLTKTGNQFSVKNGGIGSTQLATDAVTTTKLADDAVTQAKIAPGAVGTTEIADSNVTAAKISTDAVTTAKILDANVTNAKLADDAVTQSKIAANAVGSSEISAGAVGTSELASGAVTGDKIAFLAQTVAEAADGSRTNFTLSHEPVAASLLVILRGIRQRPTTDFSFSGTTLTFVEAPESGDEIAIYGMQA